MDSAVPGPTLPASFLGVVGFGVVLYAQYFLCVPPHHFNPRLVQYLGRFVFLTVHMQWLCFSYSMLALCAGLAGSHTLGTLSVQLAPLAVMLASYVTVLYYALEFANPETERRTRYWSQHGFPRCSLGGHIGHAAPLPLAIMLVLSLRGAPSYALSTLVVGGYVGFYLALTLLNKRVTGEWTYPVLDDVARRGGALGVAKLLVVLVLGSAAVGAAAVTFMRARDAARP